MEAEPTSAASYRQHATYEDIMNFSFDNDFMLINTRLDRLKKKQRQQAHKQAKSYNAALNSYAVNEHVEGTMGILRVTGSVNQANVTPNLLIRD